MNSALPHRLSWLGYVSAILAMALLSVGLLDLLSLLFGRAQSNSPLDWQPEFQSAEHSYANLQAG